MDIFTIFEIVATITGIVCVYLQTRENVWAWPFGIVSVSLLAWIFWNNRLFSDFLLHIILLVLNVYGLYEWTRRDEGKPQVPIQRYTLVQLAPFIFIIIVATPLWGYVMNTYVGASLAFFDAFTTIASLVAQYLMARKVIQNWLIWIIVDVVAIFMYIYKELYFVTMLFTVFLVLCVLGWRNWNRWLNEGGDALQH